MAFKENIFYLNIGAFFEDTKIRLVTQVLVNKNNLNISTLILFFLIIVIDIILFRLKNLLDSRFCYTTALTRGGPANSAASQNNQVTRGRPPYRGEVVEHNQGRIILNLKPIRYDGLIGLHISLKKFIGHKKGNKVLYNKI